MMAHLKKIGQVRCSKLDCANKSNAVPAVKSFFLDVYTVNIGFK